MTDLINKLERKFGKYALDNLPLIMIICYALGYTLQLINADIIYFFSLNPYAILHGQVWRLITWVIIPPDSSNLFFVLIMLYFYYSISRSLMYSWGPFYFNLYIFSGILFMIVGSFLFYGYVSIFEAETIAFYSKDVGFIFGNNYYFAVMSTLFSTYYINMSILLGFAATFPEERILLFFFIPLKMKVLGIIYAIFLVYDAFMSGWVGIFVLCVSMLNFIIFFLSTRKNIGNTIKIKRNKVDAAVKEARRKEQERQDRVRHMRPGQGVAKHKCCICGQTSDSNPDLEFRFCSKCEGNFEYCNNHIFSHAHKKRADVNSYRGGDNE